MAKEKKSTLLEVACALNRPMGGGLSIISAEPTLQVFSALGELLRTAGKGHLINLLQGLKQHNVRGDKLFIGKRQVWANTFGSRRYKKVIRCIFETDPNRQFTWGSALHHSPKEGVDLQFLVRLLADELGWVPLMVDGNLQVRQLTPEEANEHHNLQAALETVLEANGIKIKNIIKEVPHRLYYLPNTVESRLRLVREMNEYSISSQPLRGGRTYDTGGLQSCSRLNRAALLHGSGACDWDIKNTAPTLLNWMTGGTFDSLRAVIDRDVLLQYLRECGDPVDEKELKVEINSALNEKSEKKMTNDFTRGLAKELPVIKACLLERGWITEEEYGTRAAVFSAYTRVETMVIEQFKEAAFDAGCEVLATIHDGFITWGGDPQEAFKRVEERLSKEWGLDLKFIKKYVYN